MGIFIIILIIICFALSGNSEEKIGSNKTRKRSSETVRNYSIPDSAESKFFELSPKILYIR